MFFKSERFETLDDQYLKRLKSVINQVCPSLKNYEIFQGNQSVTVDKKKIYICMRSPKDGYLYDFDILTYVTLHEVAHVLSKTYSTRSHNEEFYQNFASILNKAYSLNLLKPNIQIPDDYCKSDGLLSSLFKFN